MALDFSLAKDPFLFENLVEDMKWEVGKLIALDPFTSFYFSLTSKSNYKKFFNVNLKPKSDFFYMAIAEGNFALFSFLLDYFRTSIEKEAKGLIFSWIAPAISNGHVDFLKKLFEVFPQVVAPIISSEGFPAESVFVKAGSSKSKEMIDFLLSKMDPRSDGYPNENLVVFGAYRSGAVKFAEDYLLGFAYRPNDVPAYYGSALHDSTLTSLKHIIESCDPNFEALPRISNEDLEGAVKAGCHVGFKYLLSLPCGPKLERALRLHSSILRYAISAEKDRSEMVEVLISAGVHVTEKDWDFAIENPNPKVLQILSQKYQPPGLGVPNENRVLKALLMKGTGSMLTEAFPTLSIRARSELFEFAKESNPEAAAWLLKTCSYLHPYIGLNTELQVLRQKFRFHSKFISRVIAELCSTGDSDIGWYIPEVLIEGRLKVLVDWVRKGGVLEYDSIFPRVLTSSMSESRATPGPFLYLQSHGIVPKWEHFEKVISDSDHSTLATIFINMDLYKDDPRVAPFLLRRPTLALLKLALSRGYCYDLPDVSRIMPLCVVPEIRKRFNSEWKITSESLEQYMVQPYRSEETDQVIATLVPNLEGIRWIRYVSKLDKSGTPRTKGFEFIIFSDRREFFAEVVDSLALSEAKELLDLGVGPFRESYLSYSSGVSDLVLSALELDYEPFDSFFIDLVEINIDLLGRLPELKAALHKAGILPTHFDAKQYKTKSFRTCYPYFKLKSSRIELTFLDDTPKKKSDKSSKRQKKDRK